MAVISHRLRAAVIAGVALGCLYSAATHAQKSPLGEQDNGGLNGSLSRSLRAPAGEYESLRVDRLRRRGDARDRLSERAGLELTD